MKGPSPKTIQHFVRYPALLASQLLTSKANFFHYFRPVSNQGASLRVTSDGANTGRTPISYFTPPNIYCAFNTRSIQNQSGRRQTKGKPGENIFGAKRAISSLKSTAEIGGYFGDRETAAGSYMCGKTVLREWRLREFQ